MANSAQAIYLLIFKIKLNGLSTTIVCFLKSRGIPLITPLSLRRGDGGEAVTRLCSGSAGFVFRLVMVYAFGCVIMSSFSSSSIIIPIFLSTFAG